MGFAGRLLIGGVVAGAGLAYYVHQRHVRTGDGYVDILRRLPSAAQHWVSGARERAARAIEDGRSAARRREVELTRQLEAAGASGPLDG